MDSTRPLADFRIYTGILRAARDDEGRRVFRGVASSTTRDLHGDTMELSAIEDMERAANNNLTLFLNHSYNVPEDVGGSVIRAKIAARDADHDGRPNYDLDIEGVINEANPRAVQTFNAIESGTKLGISIGAMIPEGGAELNRKTGTYTIRHVDLLEASFVGIPANPRSWVEYAVKSLKGKKAVELEEPETDEEVEDVEDEKDTEETDSQEASKGKPENENGLLDETADGDDERLGDTVTRASSDTVTVNSMNDYTLVTTTSTTPNMSWTFTEPQIQKMTELLTQTTSELVDTKQALGEALAKIATLERENTEALAQRDRVLELTAQTLDRISRIPLVRKTHFAEAESDFRKRMSSVYPEGFLKLMEDRT